MKSRINILKVTALLPLIGIMLMMGRSHLRAKSGDVYRIQISGYDPRDLIHGHYLSYRFNIVTSTSSDGQHNQRNYCFTKHAKGHDVTLVGKDQTKNCDAWLPQSKLKGSKKYLIPEAQAVQLEKALRQRESSVDLIIHANQTYTVGELYLDGLPWREALLSE